MLWIEVFSSEIRQKTEWLEPANGGLVNDSPLPRGWMFKISSSQGSMSILKKKTQGKEKRTTKHPEKIPLLGNLYKKKVHPKSRNFSSRGFYSYRVIGGTGFVHPIHQLDTHQVNQQNSII